MCQQSLLNIQAALYCFTTFLFKMVFSPNFILIFFALSLFGKPYNPNKPKYNHLQYILFISNTVCSIRQSDFYATSTCQLSSQCSVAVVVEDNTQLHRTPAAGCSSPSIDFLLAGSFARISFA